MSRSHEELQSLLGAYAVHAIDDDAERADVETHIATCEICAIELVHLQEAASLLGASEPIANNAIWEKIQAQLDDEPAAPRMRIMSGPWAASWAKPLVGAIAAALVLVVGFSAITMSRNRSSYSNEALDRAAHSALSADGSRKVVMTTDQGASATVVMLNTGAGYVINDGLDAADSGRTYQLWAMVDGTAISAGVLGPDFKVAAFTAAAPNISGFAVSEERTGGSTSPNTPVMIGTLPT